MSKIENIMSGIVHNMFRGKGAFHPCETGELPYGVKCIREDDVNIFFLQKEETFSSLGAKSAKNAPKCRFSMHPKCSSLDCITFRALPTRLHDYIREFLGF